MKQIATQGELNPTQLQEAVKQFSTLRSGMFGNMEKQFIEVARKYSPEQIEQINRSYYQTQKSTIWAFVQSGMRDQQLLDLFSKILAPRHDAWAQLINTYPDQIAPFILLMDENDCRRVKIAYKNRYQNEISSKLTQNTFAINLLKAWLNRDTLVRPVMNFKKEAQKLDEATKSLGTDEQIFLDFFTKTSFNDFKEVIAEYQKLSNETLVERLKGEFKDENLKYAQMCYFRMQDLTRFLQVSLQGKCNPQIALLVRDRIQWNEIALGSLVGENIAQMCGKM
ncbi:Annexin_11 [Hexamita inflata]|uniref:Annexin 11 n=1 Tax=Hexamita inflata TaxID=28002 RepID=A0AA86NR80_9EUKA|nr:Annexin 11 [Hexamita inflata]CAI9949637.1 Annexin 11 [Hexamita inflata]